MKNVWNAYRGQHENTASPVNQLVHDVVAHYTLHCTRTEENMNTENQSKHAIAPEQKRVNIIH